MCPARRRNVHNSQQLIRAQYMVAELIDEIRPDVKCGHGGVGTEYGTGSPSPQMVC